MATIYDSLIANDPEYLMGIAPIRQRRSDLVTQFGDASGVAGIDPSVAQAAAANPYSITQQLLHQYRGNLGQTAQNYNAQGALFSGMYRHGVAQEGDAAKARQSDAYAQFQQGLGGIQGDENNLAWSVFNRLSQAPPAAAAAPAPAGAAGPVTPNQPGVFNDPVTNRTYVNPTGVGTNVSDQIIKPLFRPPTPRPRSVWSGSGL